MNNRNVVPLFIYILLDEDEIRNHMRLYRRQLRDAQNAFEVITDSEFRKTFRFNKELARDLINTLEPNLTSIRTTAIPPYLKVLATLHFLGHGTYQHGVGSIATTALSQPSISRAIYT
ncbi:uncharacterized protein LOC111692503, partial [Anoplophora glabripennis]|uniref:uncharacterized protein LOC111692503 n=1 Tax=Anoplophora glabripennis TaxID=217634 RepID=UPI000C767631